MKELNKKRPINSFQKGIRNVSYMMIGFMMVMVPIVSCTQSHEKFQQADRHRFSELVGK